MMAKRLLARFYKPLALLYPRYPRWIQLEPTTRCNLKCFTCSRKEFPPSRLNLDLKPHQFERILEQIPTLKRIKLQGMGEPLLAKYLDEICFVAKNRGIKLETITNGTLLAKDDFIEKAKYFDMISVSIDSLDAETFARLRYGADLNDVLDGLKLLCENNGNTEVCVNVTLTWFNHREILRFEELFHAGVSRIGFVEAQNWGHGSKDFQALLKINRRVHGEIERNVNILKRKYPGRVSYTRPHYPKLCSWLVFYTFITADGYVTPCCLRPDPYRFNFGNVFFEPFASIWRGRKYCVFRLRQVLRANRVCRGCPF